VCHEAMLSAPAEEMSHSGSLQIRGLKERRKWSGRGALKSYFHHGGYMHNNVNNDSTLLSKEDMEKVPIHLKMVLTIKEAAEYSNIGINKIDTLLKQPNCPFVLYVGTRKLVKRKEFEDYISGKLII